MKCVIIGLGWLGLPLAKRLVSAGFTVAGTTRQRTISSDAITHFTYVPTGGVSKELAHALAEADCVVLAFPPNRTTVDNYATDCQQIVARIGSTTKVLLISSTGVYPDHEGSVSESFTDAFPENSNALLLAERILQKTLNDRLTIIRMAGLIGENRYPVRFMAASGKTYIGNEWVNVVHQEDAINCCLFVITKQLWGQTINCCSTEHPDKKSYYEWMAKQIQCEKPTFEMAEKSGKIVSNQQSIDLGFVYSYPSPFDFPISVN